MHTLQPSKGAFLANGTQIGEEGPTGVRQALAEGLQHWPQGSPSLGQFSSTATMTAVSTGIHLVWFFNSPPYLKMPFLPSSSILYFYHKDRNYHISQIILCCIQTTKFSHHNLLSPEPAPTIFFLPPVLTSPI